MCLRPLKSSLLGTGDGGRFPSTELKQDRRPWQLVGGRGGCVDRDSPAGCVCHLPLLGQEGLGGACGGAATQTGFNPQPLTAQTLRDVGGRDGEKLSLKSKLENAFTRRYLVVPRCDDHLLFVFSQPGLLTLALPFEKNNTQARVQKRNNENA